MSVGEEEEEKGGVQALGERERVNEEEEERACEGNLPGALASFFFFLLILKHVDAAGGSGISYSPHVAPNCLGFAQGDEGNVPAGSAHLTVSTSPVLGTF